jgi:hypothetical protein
MVWPDQHAYILDDALVLFQGKQRRWTVTRENRLVALVSLVHLVYLVCFVA